MSEQKKEANRKPKPRSPKAPSRKLEDCLEKLDLVYGAFGNGTFDRAEVASTIGSSSDSGKFGSWFTSFSEFNLIEKIEKGHFRLSETYKGLHFEKQESVKFKQHVLGAVKSSAVLSGLLDEFSNKLPPISTVAQRLERDRGFNTEKALTTAEILEDAMQFGSLIDSKNNVLPIREDIDEPRNRNKEGETNPVDTSGDLRSDEGKPPSTGLMKLEIPLADGVVVISYPKLLSSTESERVKAAISVITE